MAGSCRIVVTKVLLLSALVWFGAPSAAIAESKHASRRRIEARLSPMGQAAARAVARALPPGDGFDRGTCFNEPDCEEDSAPPSGQDDDVFIPGGQAEVSIAVDSTGQHVVIGYNDTRGFALNPLSVSGVLYSDDGGKTFVDGGQLPSPGTDVIGATRFPQVFGDPDVKYLGGCTFIYSSILVNKFSPTQAVQTMGFHRSTDCGHTWQGPFTITSATNPNGATTATGAPRDAADKEFLDVDRDTGRVIVSWSNFTPFAAGGVEIATSYSDDIMSATPTWSPRTVVAATGSDGQASIARFAAGSSDAYIAWRRFPSFYGNVIGFARSSDNGATWSAPIELSPEFLTMDQVLGNDRVNTSPSLAVDRSHRETRGNVYVVYANNDNGDGADVVFQRSTDGGHTFSAPLLLNSRPGVDRAQWFPWVTVDDNTGRIYVFYYDQGIAQDGDLSETTFSYSDDGGLSWIAPRPLTTRPFHAAWGNDTGQPNLGDYNQAVAQGGELFAAFAIAPRPPAGFADGEPTSLSFTVPEVTFKRLSPGRGDDDDEGGGGERKVITLAIAGVTFDEESGRKHPPPNGYIDPGDAVNLHIALTNYVTNPLNARRQDVEATLSTSTPGVRVENHNAHYGHIDPGETKTNSDGFGLEFASSFVPGTTVELRLELKGQDGQRTTLLHSLPTGTPVATTLYSENFNGVAPGALPAGWSVAHGGGDNVVPWTTSQSFCSATSNAAFHVNANDGPSTTRNPARFERLFSPLFNVPAEAEYVTVEFDVCYDTEEDPFLNILAYDGFLLRVTDLTPGRLLRSVLVDAFEDEFTTGSANGYVRHFPRGTIGGRYFEDMSAWAGFSNGWKHVRARLPGMAGSTAQLRFEFTQDSSGTCADLRPGHSCGVAVDNIVVRSVVSKK